MSRTCDIIKGKSNQTGHRVSHSNIKTNHKFVANLQNISLKSDILNQDYSFRIAVSTLRSIDKNGGLDGFLLKTSNLKLTNKAIRLKKLIKKKADNQKAA